MINTNDTRSDSVNIEIARWEGYDKGRRDERRALMKHLRLLGIPSTLLNSIFEEVDRKRGVKAESDMEFKFRH